MSAALKKALKSLRRDAVQRDRPFTVKFEGVTAQQIRSIAACSLDITEEDIVHTWVESYVRDTSADSELLLGSVADVQRRKRALSKEGRVN